MLRTRRHSLKFERRSCAHCTICQTRDADTAGHWKHAKGNLLLQAKLENTDLTAVNLTRAYLTRAPFTAANLTHADLTHADFTAANLTGTDLTRADLTGARGLTEIRYDEKTTWPDGSHTPPHEVTGSDT